MPTTRIATAAYNLDVFEDWAAMEEKLTRWVGEAVEAGAELLVFPEYGAMELATLAGEPIMGDLSASIDAVSERIPDYDAMLGKLAVAHDVYIVAPTAPVRSSGRATNRARLMAPNGEIGIQDKLIPTPFERFPWEIEPGEVLSVFETRIGTIGIPICYDSEFPLIARAMVEYGADILAVPCQTETFQGFNRVRIACQARALEAQAISIQSPLVGEAPWNEAVDVSHGRAAIYCPPDGSFPHSGVLVEGEMDAPGWVLADVDFAQIREARTEGKVRNFADWPEQDGRLVHIDSIALG